MNIKDEIEQEEEFHNIYSSCCFIESFGLCGRTCKRGAYCKNHIRKYKLMKEFFSSNRCVNCGHKIPCGGSRCPWALDYDKKE